MYPITEIKSCKTYLGVKCYVSFYTLVMSVDLLGMGYDDKLFTRQ